MDSRILSRVFGRHSVLLFTAVYSACAFRSLERSSKMNCLSTSLECSRMYARLIDERTACMRVKVVVEVYIYSSGQLR